MARTVTAIPARLNMFTTAPIATTARRRVAGYARVSTDSDEQYTSYEAQVDYFTRLIKSRPEWDFVKVYTDEGISAVSTKHRDGFNEMIADAMAGKIDLIVTKSVSRFARNTVDSLVTIRALKEHGCECYFEKENIFTFDGKGELLITIMSSLAQEESRSISENTTWGHRKRMADGKVSMAYSTFLGYDKGDDGNLVVNEEEAKTVRFIYRKFMEGMTPFGISHLLDDMGIPTPGGKDHWYERTILSILTNEKYKGDALLQKTFTVDFLTKKHKVNEGEVQQYYIKDNHEAIIPPEEFEQVQAELARRRQVGRAFSGNSPFSGRIICGDCGGIYGKKVWHSNDKYRKVIWRCNQKYEKGGKGVGAMEESCLSPAVAGDTIPDTPSKGTRCLSPTLAEESTRSLSPMMVEESATCLSPTVAEEGTRCLSPVPTEAAQRCPSPAPAGDTISGKHSKGPRCPSPVPVEAAQICPSPALAEGNTICPSPTLAGAAQRCTTPTLSEDEIKALFAKAFNILLADKDSIMQDCETLAAMLEDTSSLDAKIESAQAELDKIVEQNKALIRKQAVTGMAPEAFDMQATNIDEAFRKAVDKVTRLNAEKQDRLTRACVVRKYVEDLSGQARDVAMQAGDVALQARDVAIQAGDVAMQARDVAIQVRDVALHAGDIWDEQAWRLLVEKVTVFADGSAEFLFRGGNRITVRVE